MACHGAHLTLMRKHERATFAARAWRTHARLLCNCKLPQHALERMIVMLQSKRHSDALKRALRNFNAARLANA
eukprot:11187461-Lingulodinium_polyedra.AAC.1